MASLVKNIPIASFSLRGVLPLLLLIACIIALFFVPDLLRVSSKTETAPLQRAAVEDEPAGTAPVQRAADVPAEEGAAAASPLDSVLEEWNRSAQAVQAPAQSEFQIPGAQPITWDSLRSEAAQNALNRARTEAGNLLAGLPEEMVEPRQALITMIAAVDFISSDAAKTVPASEAAEQLEIADLGVAAALQDKNLDRTLYLRWMDVSLTPVLQNYRADRVKHQMLHPFDPQLRLQQVDIIKIDPPPGSNSRVQTRLVIAGTVKGDDIKRLRLFRNGVFAQEVPFSQPDDNGHRTFAFARNAAYGVWTFKAHDSKDGVYEKSYRFFPKVERFPREGYNYILPFDPAEPDPRLDALFRVGERKGPQRSALAHMEEF